VKFLSFHLAEASKKGTPVRQSIPVLAITGITPLPTGKGRRV